MCDWVWLGINWENIEMSGNHERKIRSLLSQTCLVCRWNCYFSWLNWHSESVRSESGRVRRGSKVRIIGREKRGSSWLLNTKFPGVESWDTVSKLIIRISVLTDRSYSEVCSQKFYSRSDIWTWPTIRRPEYSHIGWTWKGLRYSDE